MINFETYKLLKKFKRVEEKSCFIIFGAVYNS